MYFFKFKRRKFFAPFTFYFLCIGLFFFTPWVQNYIFEIVIEILLNEPHHKVICQGGRGLFPVLFQCNTLAIHDPKGLWLLVKDIDIDLSLKGTLNHLKSHSFQILKKPIFENRVDIPWPLVLQTFLKSHKIKHIGLQHVFICEELLGTHFDVKCIWDDTEEKSTLRLSNLHEDILITHSHSSVLTLSLYADKTSLLCSSLLPNDIKGSTKIQATLELDELWMQDFDPLKHIKHVEGIFDHSALGKHSLSLLKPKTSPLQISYTNEGKMPFSLKGIFTYTPKTGKIECHSAHIENDEGSIDLEESVFFKKKDIIEVSANTKGYLTLKNSNLLKIPLPFGLCGVFRPDQIISTIRLQLEDINDAIDGQSLHDVHLNLKTKALTLKSIFQNTNQTKLTATLSQDKILAEVTFSTPYVIGPLELKKISSVVTHNPTQHNWHIDTQIGFLPSQDSLRIQGLYDTKKDVFKPISLEGYLEYLNYWNFKMKKTHIKTKDSRIEFFTQHMSFHDFKVEDVKGRLSLEGDSLIFSTNNYFKKTRSFVKIHGNYIFQQDQLTLNTLSLGNKKHALSLKNPMKASLKKRQLISSLDLVVDGGTLKMQASQYTIQKIPLDFFSLFFRSFWFIGTIDGKGSYDASLSQGNLVISNIAPFSVTFPNHHKKAKCTLSYKTTENSFSLKSVFDQNKETLLIESSLLKDQINTRIKGILNLEFIPLGFGHRLQGTIHSDLSIKGPLKRPNFQGTVFIHKGLYEHGDYGTMLKHIEASLIGNNDRLQIKHFEAFDATSKTKNLQAQGTLSTQILDLSLSLNTFQVVNMTGLNLHATGTLALKGDPLNFETKGHVFISKGLLSLDEFNDETIPQLTIENTLAYKKEKKELQEKRFPILLTLDCSQEDLLVKGLGLNTRWRGKLEVHNGLSNPYLVGEIKLRKGHIAIFATELPLQKGSVIYDDIEKNVPLLFLESMKKADKHKLFITIQGRTHNAQVAFSSNPSLPQDSIISYILFSKNLQNVSSSEALQLASALASIRGAKGLDVTQTIKSMLNVDILQVNEQKTLEKNDDSDKKRSFLSIGKKFKRFNATIDQELFASKNETRFNIEYPLTEDTSVKLGVNQQSEANVGFDCEYRY